MCAIAGVLGGPVPEQAVQKMLRTMARRGPDESGTYENHLCTLLHTRLTIIDPEGGKQPMALSWAGERYVLVYNGELYNTEELRHQLIREGHSFCSHSDTEVLLHSFAQWGEACLEKCNGIFAFAVWEEKAGRLFLARDRIGVKPLFYREETGRFLFASEIKTILACLGVSAELDREGAAQLILLGPGRLPGSGVFRGIRELEPGCCGWLEKGKFTPRRYWKLKDGEHTDSFADTVEKVRYLVTDSIKRQMVSDMPIGTFLSGGLDSSIISAICAGELADRGERLNTFSVDYRDNDTYFQTNKFQPASDGAYIRIMQERMNSNHRWTVLSPEDLEACLEDATRARDLPGMADVDFSLLAFCREIRKDVKMALSGECADEIFGGYPWYRDPEVRSREGFPWAQNIRQRTQLLSPDVDIPGEAFVLDAYSTTCRESDVLPEATPAERRMKEMVNLNFRWFMQTLLERKDRMSMYCGLEVRVPFCDYRIAEYLYTVPWEHKDYGGREKGLLRKAMEGLLPEQVLYRKKSPYPKTFDPRYEELMTKRLEKLLRQPERPLFRIVNRSEVENYLHQDSPWPWYGQLMRKPQTIAWLLQLDFWLGEYDVSFRF